jgi:hypothetical protein
LAVVALHASLEQVKAHWPALHVAVVLAGAGQGVQDAPHVSGLALSAHLPVQT